MLHLFRANKPYQDDTRKSYEMSIKELRKVIRIALENGDVYTLKRITNEGYTVDTLPYPDKNACSQSFVLNCIAHRIMCSKISNFLLRNTRGHLLSHAPGHTPKSIYANDLLNEGLIRNDQKLLKFLWDEEINTRLLNAKLFEKYVSEYPLTETEVDSALCCLDYVIKKNHIKPSDAAQLRNFLNSIKKQPQEAKSTTPGM